MSVARLGYDQAGDSFLYPRLRPLTRRPVVRTAMAASKGPLEPADVQAAFNFEFDDIDVDVPLGGLLVEASKETPRWRVMLTPLPGATGETDSWPTPGCGDRVI